MKRLLAVMFVAAALAQEPASTVRPTIQVPDRLAAEYWRQAWVIEHATRRQAVAIEDMNSYCAENAAQLREVRDADGERSFVCVPKETKQ